MIAGTADGRRVAALVAATLATVAVLVVGAGRLAVSDGGGRPAAGGSAVGSPSGVVPPRAETTPAVGAPVVPGAGETPALGDGAVTHGHADVAPPPDLEAARQTAAAFAVGWSSYRFDEPSGAALERVRALLTPEAAASLAGGSGAMAEQERRAAVHETVTAEIDGVVTAGFDADHVLLSVIVIERIASDAGATQRSVAYEVSLERREGRWLVNAVAAA